MNESEQRYQIVCEADPEALSAAVNAAIRNGYVPIGGVTVIAATDERSTNDGNGGTFSPALPARFLQAVFKHQGA